MSSLNKPWNVHTTSSTRWCQDPFPDLKVYFEGFLNHPALLVGRNFTLFFFYTSIRKSYLSSTIANTYETFIFLIDNSHYPSFAPFLYWSFICIYPHTRPVMIDNCMLSNNIMDYYVVSQGKTSIPGVDDGEEMELTDVRHFLSHLFRFFAMPENIRKFSLPFANDRKLLTFFCIVKLHVTFCDQRCLKALSIGQETSTLESLNLCPRKRRKKYFYLLKTLIIP